MWAAISLFLDDQRLRRADGVLVVSPFGGSASLVDQFDAHARELGQVLFFRGTYCLRGHLAPYRINGGCLTCSGQKPSAAV